MTNDVVEVKEAKRTIIGNIGTKVILHNVTSFNSTGTWLRVQADEGYVLINPDNVLAMIVDGEVVR